jgi:hypothetical protein
LLTRYPLPTTTASANNFTRLANETQTQNQFDTRVDHRFGEPQQMFARYSFAQDTSNPVTPLPDGSGAIASGALGLTKTTAQSVVGNYLFTSKAGWLNETRSGFPRTARALQKLNFGPRVGLSFRATDKTVVRVGYGLIWQEQAGITTPFTIPQFPFVQTVTQRTLDNVTPAFVLARGTTINAIPLTPDAGLGQGVFGVDRILGSGYTSQWNFAVQRELTPNLVFEIACAGSKITHVGLPDVNINQLTATQ